MKLTDGEIKMTPKEVYWVAGLLEGEGYFSISTKYKYPLMCVGVNMTDSDIIEKIYKLIKMGNINGPYNRNNYKPMYQWQIDKQRDAASLIMTIYPLMGKRRQKRIKELLLAWRSFPYPHQRSCPKNHSIENIYRNSNNGKVCRECEHLRYEERKWNKILGYK